jgi:hypothetical protein
MRATRVRKSWIIWLVAGMVVVACAGARERTTGVTGVPVTATSRGSATVGVSVPVPTSTSVPTPTLTPLPDPIELTILHTNDNWGATEPCG